MVIEIKSEPVAHMNGICKCPHCRKINSTERVFLALAIQESPIIWDELSDDEKCGIASIEEAQQVATRLDITDKAKPKIICEECGKSIQLSVKHTRHEMEVPAFLSCPECGVEIDMRYPGDSKRVMFTSHFPHLPFVHCKGCKKKVLLPVMGRQAWRYWIFRIYQAIRVF